MKQCKTCMNREYKDKLTCCAVAELFHAFWELLKFLPFFGKDFKTYECGSYMADDVYVAYYITNIFLAKQCSNCGYEPLTPTKRCAYCGYEMLEKKE